MPIRISDIPDECLIHDHLQESFSLTEHWEALQKHDPDELRPLYSSYNLSSFQINFEEINREVEEIYSRFEFQGWAKPGTQKYDRSYGGIALTQNHNQQLDWKRGLLGHEEAMKKKFNFSKWKNLVNSKGHFQFLKNTLEEKRRGTYYDSYSFHIPTKICDEFREIHKITTLFKRPFFRSRIATIPKGHKIEPQEGWHRDERLFLFYRAIIPLQTNENCKIQVETHEGKKDFSPQVGMAYTFNTRLPHAAFTTEACNFDRHYLVFCFSPWMDFSREDQSFQLNEHAGKTHPFDLFNFHTFNAA